MKISTITIGPFIFVLLLTCFSTARGDLDFEQEVLQIPGTHESKEYIWEVRNDPPDFRVVFERDKAGGENQHRYKLRLSLPAEEAVEKIHLFITDQCCLIVDQ